MAAKVIAVDVAYALPERQVIVGVQIHEGATLRDAIDASGLVGEFPDIDLDVNSVGVYGHVQALDDPVQANDRVEIYRSLIADPKDIRRSRAKAEK